MTTRLTHALVAGVVVALFGAAPVAAQSGSHDQRTKVSASKLDGALLESLNHAPKPERVIIRLKPGSEEAMKKALQEHGDIVDQEHEGLGALTAIVHGEDLEALANDPNVESLSADLPVRVHGTKSRTVEGIGAAEVVGFQRQLQGLSTGEVVGSGVGVAIIDSGIQLSESLRSQVTAFVDFTRPGDPVVTRPYDDYGHGTFIANLIANSGKDGWKYQGVAPGAHLIGLKVLNQDGNGLTSDVIAAIEFAVANRQRLDIDVINLSLGHPIFESAATDPLVQAVERAVRHGIAVVVSAGNFGMDENDTIGYGGITSPGNAPSAVTVGAADTKNTVERTDDVVAPFSSRGPAWFDGLAKPDVVAPGVNVEARAAVGGKLLRFGGDGAPVSSRRFVRLSGTSVAAGVASGVVALVLEANGRLTPNALKAILEYTATPLADGEGGLFDALTQGTGEVNGDGAIVLADAVDPTVPAGSPWLVKPVTPVTTFGTTDAAWAQHIIWGNYYVGGTVLQFNASAWGENVVWGNVGGAYRGGNADNVVWGTLADRDQADNVVWGNFQFERDGDNIVWGNFSRDGDDNIIWGNALRWDDNVVWGNAWLGFGDGDNVVWGNFFGWDGDGDNVVWGNIYRDGDIDNVVWGNALRDCDNIVWGNARGDNIVWGNSRGDNIVWGNASRGGGDNIVWGNTASVGKVK